MSAVIEKANTPSLLSDSIQFSKLNFAWGKTLPMILQTEAAECGLASLAMVAGYHGYHTDLATLRQRFAVLLNHLIQCPNHPSAGQREVDFDTQQLTIEIIQNIQTAILATIR